MHLNRNNNRKLVSSGKPANIIFCRHFFASVENYAEGGGIMTQLELMIEIGSESMRLARMYCEGIITLGELKNILGEAKVLLVHQYIREYVI